MEQVTTVRASELEVPEDYIVLERNPDGSVLLGPDTSWTAIRRRHGLTDASSEQFDATFGDLPTDDED